MEMTTTKPTGYQSIVTDSPNDQKEELIASQIYDNTDFSPTVIQEMTESPDHGCCVSLDGCSTLLDDLEMDDDLQQIFDLIQSQ
jgi:hypothetical protein